MTASPTGSAKTATNAPEVACSTIPLQQRRLDTSVRAAGVTEWDAALSEIRVAGFSSIDLVDSWLAPAELSEAELGALVTVLRDLDLSVVGLSIARRSVIDPEHGEANLAYAHRSIECAARLGAPLLDIGFHRPLLPTQLGSQFWMVPGAVDDRSEETWKLAGDRVGEIADHAASVGLSVALELYEDTLLGSSADALRVVSEIDRPNVGVNADIGNLIRVPRRLEESWAQLLSALLPHMNYWHVKNYIRLEQPELGIYLSYPTDLDVGVINYREALRLALGSGYGGPMCIEYYEGDALGAAAKSRRYLLGLLDELGARDGVA